MAETESQSANTPDDAAVANILLLLNLADDDAIWYWRQTGGSLDEYLKTKRLRPGALELARSIFADLSDFERKVFAQSDVVRRWRTQALPEDESSVIKQMLDKQAESSILSMHGPSFWERNGLVASDGTVRTGRVALLVVLCVVLISFWGRMFFSGKEVDLTIAHRLTQDVEGQNWATRTVRQRHITKLNGICQRLKEYSAMPDAQDGINQIIATADAYLAEVKARDPDFNRIDANLFKSFSDADQEYQRLKQEHLPKGLSK